MLLTESLHEMVFTKSLEYSNPRFYQVPGLCWALGALKRLRPILGPLSLMVVIGISVTVTSRWEDVPGAHVNRARGTACLFCPGARRELAGRAVREAGGHIWIDSLRVGSYLLVGQIQEGHSHHGTAYATP